MLQNCHLLDDAAAAIVAAALKRLLGSPTDLERARNAGSVRADWQWSNRGLGGYRRWCAGEGALAAAWIERLRTDPDAPPPPLDDGLTPR